MNRPMSALLPLLLIVTSVAVRAQQDSDEIDSAFTGIVRRIDMMDRTNDFGFDNSFGLLFPRVKALAQKIGRLLEELYQANLGDEAQVLKQSFVDLGSQGGLSSSSNPWLDSLPFQSTHDRISNGQQLEKRVDDLDSLVSRYEQTSSDLKKLPPIEREKAVASNRKTYSLLNVQHRKLLKKCFYTRTRIEYMLRELYELNGNKNLTERLETWKRFIENNEYVLNQQLTRAERDLLYSFLAKKLRDTETDLLAAEELVFALV